MPSTAERRIGPFLARSCVQAARAYARGAVERPGTVLALAAYTATAIGLHAHAEAQLFGLLAAVVVAIAWYASPARSWEADRRAPKSSGKAGESS